MCLYTGINWFIGTESGLDTGLYWFIGVGSRLSTGSDKLSPVAPLIHPDEKQAVQH